MREHFFLLNRRSTFKNAKYIIVLKQETTQQDSGSSWEGKMNQLKKFFETSSNDHISSLKKLDKQLDKVFTEAIDYKLRPL